MTTFVNLIKLFFDVVSVYFQPSLVFVSKARYLEEESLKGVSLVLKIYDIRLGWKGMLVTESQAF